MLKSAACCAAQSSGSMTSTRLKGLAFAEVSALTVRSQIGRQNGIVSIRTTDPLRKDTLTLETASSGYGCNRGTQAGAAGATRRDAKTRSVYEILGEAMGERGPQVVRTSLAATSVVGGPLGTAPLYWHSGCAIQTCRYAAIPSHQCGPKARECAPPGTWSVV